MAEINEKKLVNAKALQQVAKGVYEQVQEDIDAKVAGDKPAEEVTFEADMVTVNALGGIKAGQDLNGMTIQEVLTKLLYPHVDHLVSSVSSNPNGGTFEYGDVQTVTSIKGTVTKKSNPITKVEIKDGSNVLATKEATEVAAGGTFTFAGLNIEVSSNGKKFQFVAYAPGEDGNEKAVSANTGTFTFVYPYYYGVVAPGTEITGELIAGMTKKVESKGNKTLAYTANNQCAVIAYPKSYGQLKKVLDPNSFDNTAAFIKHEVEVVGRDGSSQPYYVYVNGAFTNTDFKFTFSY